jgi:hypothetical protein
MSLLKLERLRNAQEMAMELFTTGMPEWLVWVAAGLAGAFALTAVAGILEAAFDLDAG